LEHISATAAGNARSAATVAAKLPEPSDCPAGRRFAAALWLGHVIVSSQSSFVGVAPKQQKRQQVVLGRDTEQIRPPTVALSYPQSAIQQKKKARKSKPRNEESQTARDAGLYAKRESQ
jgi:hypothetical protein